MESSEEKDVAPWDLEKPQKTKFFRHWYLTRLVPHLGGLNKTLPVFFKQSRLLKSCHLRVRGSEERELKYLLSALSSDRDLLMARSLLALRLACYLALRSGFDGDIEKLSKTRFSWILSCRPSGGYWTGPGKILHCHHLFCPWCWLRRHNLLYRSLIGKPGCSLIDGDRKVRGLGLGSRLHCLSFRAHGERFFSSPAALNELRRLSEIEVKPFKTSRVLLRVVYPMTDLRGATVAFMSDRPFENITTGVTEFPTLEKGKLGVGVTDRKLPFSRLYASRMTWIPEMLLQPELAGMVCEAFRGKNLFNVSGG